MDSLNRQACQELLSSPETFTTPLLIMAETVIGLEHLYGTQDQDALDPISVFEILEEKFDTTLTSAGENRLQAALLLRSTTAFEQDPQAFTAMTLAITEGQLGDMVTGGIEVPDFDECVWAVFEAAVMDPDLLPLSEQLQTFIRSLHDQEHEDAHEDPGAVEQFGEQLQDFTGQLRSMGLSEEQIQAMVERGIAAIEYDYEDIETFKEEQAGQDAARSAS